MNDRMYRLNISGESSSAVLYALSYDQMVKVINFVNDLIKSKENLTVEERLKRIENKLNI